MGHLQSDILGLQGTLWYLKRCQTSNLKQLNYSLQGAFSYQQINNWCHLGVCGIFETSQQSRPIQQSTCVQSVLFLSGTPHNTWSDTAEPIFRYMHLTLCIEMCTVSVGRVNAALCITTGIKINFCCNWKCPCISWYLSDPKGHFSMSYVLSASFMYIHRTAKVITSR